MTAAITSISYALPEFVLTNEQLGKLYPDWDYDRLIARTGVHERRIAAENETALDLAEDACRNLINKRKVNPDDIDAVIFSSQTHDYPIPSNGCILHGRLGLRRNAPVFDGIGGCSGYIYGLRQAKDMIANEQARNVLLVTADTYSRLINNEDRATRCLFGDGAAATIIGTRDNGCRIIDISLGVDGRYYNRFIVPAGGTRQPSGSKTKTPIKDKSGNLRTAEDIRMDGMGVLSFFNSVIPGEVNSILKKNCLRRDDIDFFVFHQASAAALDSLQKILRIPEEKMVREMKDVGNLVAASIPVALKRAIEHGKISGNKTIVLCGFGVGLTWGTAIVHLCGDMP